MENVYVLIFIGCCVLHGVSARPPTEPSDLSIVAESIPNNFPGQNIATTIATIAKTVPAYGYAAIYSEPLCKPNEIFIHGQCRAEE